MPEPTFYRIAYCTQLMNLVKKEQQEICELFDVLTDGQDVVVIKNSKLLWLLLLLRNLNEL